MNESAVPEGEAAKAEGTLIEMAKAFFNHAHDLNEIVGFLGKKTALAVQSSDVGSSDDLHRRAEARYRTLVEQIPALTFMAALNEENTELYISPQIEGLLGFSPHEWLSDPIQWFYQIHEEDREAMAQEFARACVAGGPFKGEFRVYSKNRSVVWVHCEAKLVRDDRGIPLFLQGVAFDITVSKSAEEKIRASLREKEVLLKEIHHRVKNNLQITSSLLKLQSVKLKDPEAKKVFVESENRIHSMALVHEKLYLSKDLGQINFEEYIHELTEFLARSFGLNRDRVEMTLDTDPIFLGIDIAISCGLILNELVSNCMKHAFSDSRTGTIHISFKQNEKNAGGYVLAVSDNGKGLPPDLNVQMASSLGLRLITNLTEQIEGKLTVTAQNPGARFEISFGAGFVHKG